MHEKRQFERVEYDGAVHVEVHDRRFQAHLLDVSVGGAFVLTEERLAFGDPVRLLVPLPALQGMNKGPAQLGGTVRWVKKDGFGVQFGRTGALETYALADYVARKSKRL